MPQRRVLQRVSTNIFLHENRNQNLWILKKPHILDNSGHYCWPQLVLTWSQHSGQAAKFNYWAGDVIKKQMQTSGYLFIWHENITVLQSKSGPEKSVCARRATPVKYCREVLSIPRAGVRLLWGLRAGGTILCTKETKGVIPTCKGFAEWGAETTLEAQPLFCF